MATEIGIVDRVFNWGRAHGRLVENMLITRLARNASNCCILPIATLTTARANAFAGKLHCAVVAQQLHKSVLERRAERVPTAKE